MAASLSIRTVREDEVLTGERVLLCWAAADVLVVGALVGVAVHYCAEQFENDGSPVATIVKGVKRAMAVKTTVYRFHELTEAAKENARAWFREGVGEYDWYASSMTISRKSAVSSASNSGPARSR